MMQNTLANEGMNIVIQPATSNGRQQQLALGIRPASPEITTSANSNVVNNQSPSKSKSLRDLFYDSWNQIKSIIERPLAENMVTDSYVAGECVIIGRLTDQIMKLLSNNSSNEGPDGVNAQVLELFFEEEVMERLHTWCMCRGDADRKEIVTRSLLSMYEELIGLSRQRLLKRKEFVLPLLRHLESCASVSSLSTEEKLVLVLNQVCVGITQHSSIILDVLIEECQTANISKGQGCGNAAAVVGGVSCRQSSGFHVLSLLLPYVHRDGVLGQQARDALLLILTMSSEYDRLGRYIAENSYFCPVLATGLSGLYSTLSCTLTYPSDDWCQITRKDIDLNGNLHLFLDSLIFCNAITMVAHPLVRDQLLMLIYNGFLIPVVGPALHQSSIEEVIAATAYLDVFLRTITEPALMRVFLCFILTSTTDGLSVLDLLINRINTSATRLCMVTLTLFRTLVELNCEDVMFQLVFKYLLPCNHVMLSQQKAFQDEDIGCETAKKLLSLTPTCCKVVAARSNIQAIPEDSVTSATNSPRADSRDITPTFVRQISSSVSSPSVSSPFSPFQSIGRLSFRTKPKQKSPVSSVPMDLAQTRRRSNTESSPSSVANSPVLSKNRFPSAGLAESDYAEYLGMAKRQIQNCAQACIHWSALYDGKGQPPLTAAAVRSPQIDQGGCISNSASETGTIEDPLLNISSAAVVFNVYGNSMENSRDMDEVDSGRLLENEDINSSLNDLNSFLLQLDRMTITMTSQSNSCTNEDECNVVVTLQDFEVFICNTDKLRSQKKQSVAVVLDKSNDRNDCTKKVKSAELSHLTLKESDAVASDITAAGEISTVSDILQHADDLKLETKGDVTDSSVTHCLLSQLSSTSLNSQPASTASTGPFLTTLLNKLEMMKQNTFYVNIQLTGVIARLACYPQPLLKSLLLSHKLVFQPYIKSLAQVLNTVKIRLEEYLYTVEEREVMLAQAHQYLLWREKAGQQLDGARGTGSAEAISREIANVDDKKITFRERLFGSKPKPVVEFESTSARYNKPVIPQFNDAVVSLKAARDAVEKKNAVYAALVFKEFLKELAALSQEHSILTK